MAKLFGLQINGAAYSVTFAVEGRVLPRYVAEYSTNTNPRVVTALREVWACGRCILTSTHATTPAKDLLEQFFAIVAKLETRTASPVNAKLIWDPAGTPSTIRTLGPNTHERFQIEAVEVVDQPDIPKTHDGRTSVAVNVTISAVERFANATTGMVTFDQSVELKDKGGGLVRVTYTSEIETKENVDARTKAYLYALAPIDSYGPTFSWKTNDENGMDVETLDSDTVNSRVPTHVIATSVIEEWGVRIGASDPGTGPSEVGYRVKDVDDAKQTVTTTTIFAKGPNYLAWIASMAPTSYQKLEKDEQHESDQATYVYTTTVYKPEDNDWELDVEITGGAKASTWDVLPNGFEPIETKGGYEPWQARVSVTVERRGIDLTNKDLLLPGLLPAPWSFQENDGMESAATEIKDEKGIDRNTNLFRRRAVAVYKSPSAPREAIMQVLRASKGVQSYRGLK